MSESSFSVAAFTVNTFYMCAAHDTNTEQHIILK